ncbi:MAG: magnesium transporter [Bdellovibrionales bacterium]
MTLNPTNVFIVRRLLGGRHNRPLRAILKRIPSADLTTLFIALSNREKKLLVEALMSIDKATDTLMELPVHQLTEFLEMFEANKLYSLLTYCPEDHASYILSTLSADKRDEVLSKLDPMRQKRLIQLLDFPEDSAGRIMDTQVFTLPSHLTAQEAIDYLRQKAPEQSLYYIYCTDSSGKLFGVCSLRALTTAQANVPLVDLAKTDIVTIPPQLPKNEVARIVSHYDLIAIPVVDPEKKLLGIITVDDVVDIIQEQATAEAYASAGLQEDDRIYSQARRSFGFRLPWMVFNLFTAFLASSVVGMFEETMNELIILAVLNNIVAGMGGNAAIQSLTVVTRGIATDDFKFISYSKAVLKEMLVGVSIGAVTGVCCAFIVYFWKGSLLVSGVIATAMIINCFIATTFGSMIPIILRKLKWDPAVGSGVIVTTFTDCAGFFSFLGIATLALKYFGNP